MKTVIARSSVAPSLAWALAGALAGALALAACGGSSTPAAGGGGGPAEAAPGPLAAGAWAAMDHDARLEFMKRGLMPVMAAEFKAFDGERYADFDCSTCHGPGAAEGNFELPNAELAALSVDMIMNPDDDHKAITEFMGAKVKPGVARLLGLAEYSPATPDGFGCFACHPMVP